MSDSVFDLMEQMGYDAGATSKSVTAPSDDKLSRVRQLAEQQLVLERRIEKGKRLLEQLNTELHELRTKTLPDAMREIGMNSFEMTDGSEVTVSKMYFASIPSEESIEKAKTLEEQDALRDRRAKAFDWLRGQGHGDLIKNTFRIVFGKGDDKKAASLMNTLVKKKLDFTRSEGVHASTLKAFVREQIEKGRPIASDLLGASALDVSNITPRKEKKTK